MQFTAANLPPGGSDPGTSFDGRFGLSIAPDGTVSPAFTGSINLGLHLNASIPGVGLGLGADLVGHWGFSNAPAGQLGGGAGGSLAFHNVTLDVGSVMHGLVQDVIDDVRKFTGPLEPLYRVAATELPILGDVGVHVSLLQILDDKAKAGDGSAGQAADGLRFIHFVNDVLPAADGSGTLNLGDFTLIGGSTPGVPFDVGAAAVPGGLPDGFNALTGGLAATYQDQGGFTFPFVQDPAGSIFKALVGRSDVDLFHFSSPEFHLHADVGLNFGVKGVAGLFFGGTFDLQGHIEGGYDLTGVKALVAGDNLGLLKGFYIDADPAKTYIQLHSFLGLSASVPLVTVSGGVHFDASIGLDQSLRDPAGTRVRPPKLIGRISENPLYAFEASGSVYAAASIDVGVDLGFGAVTLYHDDFARVELANFDSHYRPPGAFGSGTDAGPSHVVYIHMTPGPDQVVVQPFLRRELRFVGDPKSQIQVLNVDSFGYDIVYPDHTDTVYSVIFDSGNGSVLLDANWIALLATDNASAGDDSINIRPLRDERPRGAVALNLPMPNALLYGGPGDDTLVDDNPSIPAYMIGGDGNDYLGVTRSSLVLSDGTLGYYTPDQINTVRRAYGDSADGFNPIGNPELSVHRAFAGARNYDFDLGFNASTLPILNQVVGLDYTGAGGNDTLVGMNVYGGVKNDSLIGTTVLQGGDGDDAITPVAYNNNLVAIDTGAGLDTVIVDEFRSPLDSNPINLNLSIRGDGADSLIVHPYLKSVISATNRPPLNDNIRVSASRGAVRVTSNGYSNFSIQATGLASLNLVGFNHVAVEDTHGTGVKQVLVDLPRQGASDVTLSGETSLNEARDAGNANVVRVDRAGAGTGADAPVFVTEMRRDDTLVLSGGAGSNFYSARYEPLETRASRIDFVPFPPTDDAAEDYFFKVQVIDLGKSGSLNGLVIDATALSSAYFGTSYTLHDGGLDVFTNASDPSSLVASTVWFLNGTPVTVVLPGSIPSDSLLKPPHRGVQSVTVNRTWDAAPATIDASKQDSRFLNGGLTWLVVGNQGTLTLLGSAGPDAFVVQSTSGNLKIDGQGGANQATLGANGRSAGVAGTINLLAQGGAIDVNVDGSSFGGSRQAWVFAGFLFNILPATVYYDPATTSRLDVTDNGQDDLEVVDVNAAATSSTCAGRALKVSAASKPLTVDVRATQPPTVVLGGTSGVRNIKGAVSVQGLPFHATIEDSAAASYNRPAGVVSVDGLGQTQVAAVANAPITLGAGLLDLSVRTSPWNFSLSLLGTPVAPVNIDGPGAAVTIAATGGPVSTHNTRRVTVGAGSLDAIRGPVSISAGDAVATALVVDDSTDALFHAATLGASPAAGFGRVGGLSPGSIDYATANVSALTFKASAASATSTLLVSDTNVAATTIIGGVGPVRVAGTTNPLTIEGGAVLTIGTGTLNAIAGPILVRRDTTAGTVLNQTLTIDDSADVTARSVAVDVKQVVRNADFGLMAAQTNVTGLSPALIAYWPAQIGAVSIIGGTGADAFDVRAVDATDNLTIVGGVGNDSFMVGDLSRLRGPMTFRGGAGQDTLTLSDAAQSAGGTYTLTGTTVTAGTNPPITFDTSMDFIDLTTGSGDDLVKILSTTDRYGDTAVHTGAGDDRIDVQSKSTAGLLHIDGGPGRNAVRVGSLSRSAADLAARSGNLDALQGYVYVGHNDGGIDDLVIDDSGHTGGRGGLVFGLTRCTASGEGTSITPRRASRRSPSTAGRRQPVRRDGPLPGRDVQRRVRRRHRHRRGRPRVAAPEPDHQRPRGRRRRQRR
ncbi:MAG: hypothetical protein U0835_15920 [Isosphaeraceae bacterium]